ncbi:MAG: tetratricopeptide repeat protein [Bryobacteraceae bacterium]|jgi:tetratricopeptide (TPR) repeat protein
MNATGFRGAALAAVLALMLGVFASGQQQGGGQSGGTGGGGASPAPAPTPTPTPTPTPSPTKPTTPTPFPGQQQQPTFQDFQRPIYISGRVMMEDGTPPPEPVMMVMVCNGRPRPQGYTDTKGRFNIALGQNQAVFADASMDSTDMRSIMNPGPARGISERDLVGCEFRAELAGHQSDVIQLAGRRVLDNPEVGVIVLRRMANVEGFTFSLTTANAPKEAKKAFEKGLSLVKKKKMAEAEPHLRKAVEIYPKFAAAWLELGNALDAQKKTEEARTAWEKSIEADPKFIGPHLNLLQLALNSRDWEQIAQRSEAVLKLNPFSYPQVWFVHSAANYNLGRRDVAEKSAREAIKLDPNHRNPRVYSLMAYILRDKGDYSGALDHMKGYLSFAPNAPDAESVKQQIAELERIVASRPSAVQRVPEQ